MAKSQKNSDGKTQPGWHVRLPYRYQHAIMAWQEQFEKEHGVVPDLVDGVSKALDEFLSSISIDPKTFPNTKPKR